jgi:hypothetical protein
MPFLLLPALGREHGPQRIQAKRRLSRTLPQIREPSRPTTQSRRLQEENRPNAQLLAAHRRSGQLEVQD